MRIGILTAMPEEFSAVAASLGNISATQCGIFRAGRCNVSDGHDFLLLESGMGLGNAADATEVLIQEFHPDLLISSGFCGAITPETVVGDCVVAKHIIIADERGCEEIPVHLSDIGQSFVARQKAEGARFVAGTFISTARITSKTCLAKMVPFQPPPLVVDMESGAIAIIATEHTIPLVVIRTVSDGASEELGFSLHEFCDPDMRRIRPYKVVMTILRKPCIIPQLARLFFNSRKAAENLTTAFSRLLSTFQNSSGR